MGKTYEKILLVSPGKSRALALCEPLALGFLASYVMAHGFDVRIADELAGDNVEEIIEDFRPDLVGITACTPVALDAYRIAEMARSRGMVTVMGGVHASTMTEEALRHVDMVVKGEGEVPLLEIMQKRRKTGVFSCEKAIDLSTCPPPARQLMRMEFYLGARQRYSHVANYLHVPLRERVLNLMVGRGCYWKCIFCHNTWRDKPCRHRSLESVIGEIDDIEQSYGVKYICFMDDNLFGYRRFTEELFKEIISRKTNVIWGANARVDCVNEEILSLAWEAGCRRINFGFESGSQSVLDTLKKGIRVKQIEKAVNLCKKQGMIVVGTFMVGTPGETKEDIEKTRRLIRSLPLNHVGICLTTPFPGTELWNYCEERDLVPEVLDWSQFDFHQLPFRVSDQFTEAELTRIQRNLFLDAYFHNPRIMWYLVRSFYLNPAQILRRIASICFHKQY